MKRIILKTVIFVLIAAWEPLAAYETGENESIEPAQPRIAVEISDEAAIILDGQRYSLSEMIKKSIELNPDIYITRYSAAMADTGLKKFDSKYSALFNASGSVSSVSYPEPLYDRYWKKNESAGASASVAKSFSSGTTVIAGVGHTYSDLNTGFGPEYDINNPVVFAAIEQELLKNAFGYAERREKMILENETKMQRDAHIYSISMIALGVIADYWDVVLARNHLDNSRIMLAETLKVRRIVSEKVDIGLSEKFEINYWNSLVSSSKASVSQAEQRYRNAMRKLLRDVNVDRKITMQEKVILTGAFPEINSGEAIKRAFGKRADYLNAVREVENAKLSLSINENAALPSLKGSFSVSSMDYNIESAGDAYSNTARMKYPGYEAKLSMTYPLNDTGREADERNAGWIVEQSKKRLESTTRTVKDDVITKIENISTGYRLYSEAKEARTQSELYYNKMVINLRRGRFAASSVRDALDAFVSCRETELQLLVGYNLALIEFEVSKNGLFERYGIDINAYIPKE